MAFLIVAFKARITYRSSALFAMASSIIEIFIKLALWIYLYRDSQDMIEYMIMYTVLSNVISLFYIDRITRMIGDKITDGSITVDLMKPYHFIFSNYMQCLGELLANILLKGLPIILVFSVSLYKYADSIVVKQLPAALLAIVMGHFLYVLIFIIIGMSAMAFLEIQRIIRDIIQVLSGAFIPLSLFPDALYRINLFLPFRFLFSFPLELMLNECTPSAMLENFRILSIWLILLVMLVCALEKYLTKRLIVQGG